jgi:hypothetical protein
MNMKKIGLILVFLSIISAHTIKADEGMWLIQALNSSLQKKMRSEGLKIDSKIIYSETESSLKDAVVALDFGCTGSMISNKGLLITNHHCAFNDIYQLSTPEHNYLETGYWAVTPSLEIPIKGKSVYFLRKVIDCTEEIKQIKDSLENSNLPSGMRRIYSIIESRHTKQSGYETSCASMWDGSQYYMYYYDKYTDIRFVGAPPVQVAAFGGDIDNWEWPQHKNDFALYRVYGDENGRPAEYSANNKPIIPKKILKIAQQPIKANDFAMVIGFPGRTDRYSSSFKADQAERVVNPIMVEGMKSKMDIIKKWMNKDSSIRQKYSNLFFSLSNVQELLEGEMNCMRRFDVVEKKQATERQFFENNDPFLQKMETAYKSVEDIEKYINYYRQSLVSGKGFIAVGNRINYLKNKDSSLEEFIKRVEKIYEEYDVDVEKELMEYQLGLFFENVPEKYWGPFTKSLKEEFNNDYFSMTKNIFDNSIMLNPEKFTEAVKNETNTDQFLNDPAAKLATDIQMTSFRKDQEPLLKETGQLYTLDSEYGRLLYEKRKQAKDLQYPDANSTMRLTYGKIGSINPSDGIYYSAQSTTQGILDKYNPNDYDFAFNEKALNLIKARDWGKYGEKGKLYVNFLTDNDITGGNSGSPVLNGKGELIGLAFDGNKESLASNYYFQDDMSKCVCVDIRYVLWYIDKCTNVQYLLNEIQ